MLKRLTTTQVMTVATLLAVLLIGTRPPTDTDTWWHLRSAAWMLDNGVIRADPFSHTQGGEPWVNHSWGSQLLLHGAYTLAGDAGLALFTALAAATGMGFVWATGSGTAYVRGFVVVLAAATASVFWSPRPQMASFALSTVFVWVLYTTIRQQAPPRRLWVLVPLMALWANLHGGFSIGFVLLGGTLAGGVAAHVFTPEAAPPLRVLGQVAAVAALGVGAACLNPYGPRLLLVPFETINLQTLSGFIQEWNPPDFHNPQMLPFIVLVIVLLGATGGSPRRLRWFEFVLLGGTLYMALTAARNIALFAVVAAPILMDHANTLLRERGWLAHTPRRVPGRAGALNLALVALLVVGNIGVMANTLRPAAIEDAQAQALPVAATAALAEQAPPGALFNSYNWGGYLAFALPTYPVFVDGRTDLYGDDFLTMYRQTYTAAPGWQATLDNYNVRVIMVEQNSPLAAAAESEGWQLVYTDDLAVIYTR